MSVTFAYSDSVTGSAVRPAQYAVVQVVCLDANNFQFVYTEF